jgi:uncharacterized protein (DUF2062 family)
MLWEEVPIHLQMGIFLLVALEVNLQIAFGTEAVSTDITLVRPFSCKYTR